MKKLREYRSLAINLVLTGGVLTLVFAGLLVLSSLISNERVEENGLAACRYLTDRGMRPIAGPVNSELFAYDYYTDNIMVSECFVADGKGVIDESMNAPYYEPYTEDYSSDSQVKYYGRYWHGYKTTLRPMLAFFDIRQIYTIDTVILWTLFALCIWLMYRKLDAVISLIFALSVLMVGFVYVGSCLQYTTCFMLMLIFTAFSLMTPKGWLTRNHLCITMFTAGAVTVYFDFLTTPLLTLCMPLAVALLRINPSRGLRLCALGVTCWFLGYAGLWLMKWVLASVLTGENILANACSQLILRSGGELDFEPNMHLRMVYLAGIPLAGAVVAATVAVVWSSSRTVDAGRRYGWLLMLSLLPPVWLLVAANHSLTHFWFVWRVLAASVFCYFTFVYAVYKHRIKPLK